MPRAACAKITTLAILAGTIAWGSDSASPERIRLAADKAIALLQSSQSTWNKKKLGEGGCLSCHHQILPALAFRAARQHGLAVNEQIARADAVAAFSFYADLDRAIQYTHVIEPSMFDAFRMIGEDAAGARPTLTRAVYARLIASRQGASGAWDHDSFHERPPSSYSPVTHTAFAIRALRLYAHPSLKADTDARVAHARTWLLSYAPRDTEERTYQLFGLLWSGGGDPAARRKLAQELMTTQRADGGWNSLDGRASEAYSTGEALVALHEAGDVPTSDPAWQRGLEFLLRTQEPDGSWHVASRLNSLPVSPPYMETGYPYGHDQFLSIEGASFAIMALALCLGPARGVTLPPLAEAEPSSVEPWAETILFGSTDDIKRLLDSGFDPNSATKSGRTTALMMAAPDPAKMTLLLDRGAQVNARSKTKFNALLVAAQYRDSSAAIRLLLRRGAEVLFPKGQGTPLFNAHPLFLAAYAGNADILPDLKRAGDRPDAPMTVLGQGAVIPLTAAVQLGSTEVVRTLLELGAPVDQAEDNADGLTALDRAVLANNVEMAKLLIKYRASVNHRDSLGMTPLLYAASVDYGDSAMIDLLLQSGADRKQRTKDGLEAFDLARKYGHNHLLASLDHHQPN